MRKEDNKEIYQHRSEIDELDKDINQENQKRLVSYAEFVKHTNLQNLHAFIYHAIKVYYKDVRVNDPIIGDWDIYPYLRHNYKITIEEIQK